MSMCLKEETFSVVGQFAEGQVRNKEAHSSENQNLYFKCKWRPLIWKCDIFSPECYEISSVPFDTRIFILLWQSDKTGNWDNRCVYGDSCHRKAHKTRNNSGSSRRNCHTTRSNAHNSRKGDDFLPVWNSLLYHFFCKPPSLSSRVLIITFSPPPLLITQVEKLQNLSRAFCHLSRIHCHFSFLTFSLSLDWY